MLISPCARHQRETCMTILMKNRKFWERRPSNRGRQPYSTYLYFNIKITIFGRFRHNAMKNRRIIILNYSKDKLKMVGYLDWQVVLYVRTAFEQPSPLVTMTQEFYSTLYRKSENSCILEDVWTALKVHRLIYVQDYITVIFNILPVSFMNNVMSVYSDLSIRAAIFVFQSTLLLIYIGVLLRVLMKEKHFWFLR